MPWFLQGDQTEFRKLAIAAILLGNAAQGPQAFCNPSASATKRLPPLMTASALSKPENAYPALWGPFAKGAR